MPPPLLLVWAVVPILCAVLWRTMDTTPTLYVYDAWVPLTDHALADQTIWIVGASSGIGAAMVCQVAKAGAAHVILSARNVTRLTQVVQTCSTTTVATTFSMVPYNALSDKDPTTVVAQAIASLPTTTTQAEQSLPPPTIDIFIWSTGIYQLQPALQVTDTQRQQLWQTNYHAAVDLTQALLQQYHDNNDAPHIVIISSLMAKGPHALCSTYAATKTALRSYFQTLAVEGALRNGLTMVLPGATATPFFQNTPSTKAIGVNSQAMVTPERVARLSVQAIRSPLWFRPLFYEIWISKANGLVYGFLSHYFPGLFYAINHVVGRIRVAAFASQAADLLTLSELGSYLLTGGGNNRTIEQEPSSPTSSTTGNKS